MLELLPNIFFLSFDGLSLYGFSYARDEEVCRANSCIFAFIWWGLDDPLLLHYEFHPSLFPKGLFNPCWWLPQIVEIVVSRSTCSSSLPVTYASSWSCCSIVDWYAITRCIPSTTSVGMVIWYFWFPTPLCWNMNASWYAWHLLFSIWAQCWGDNRMLSACGE